MSMLANPCDPFRYRDWTIDTRLMKSHVTILQQSACEFILQETGLVIDRRSV